MLRTTTDTPVIVWSSRAGADAVGGGGEPDLAVFVDGRVRVAGRFAAGGDGGEPIEGRIPPAEVEALLEFILREQGFPAIDAEAVRRRVEARDAERRAAAAAAGTVLVAGDEAYRGTGASSIRVAPPDGRAAHEVTMPGLFAAARDHPEIAELARLRAIELRLLRLAETIARPPAG